MAPQLPNLPTFTRYHRRQQEGVSLTSSVEAQEFRTCARVGPAGREIGNGRGHSIHRVVRGEHREICRDDEHAAHLDISLDASVRIWRFILLVSSNNKNTKQQKQNPMKINLRIIEY